MAKSLFSQIIDREIPANIVYEDDDFIAFNDIHPKAPVHVLIVPKKTYQTLEDVSPNDEHFHGQFLLAIRKVAKLLGIEKNYKVHLNVGKDVQVVHHVHAHLLGGWGQKKNLQNLAIDV